MKILILMVFCIIIFLHREQNQLLDAGGSTYGWKERSVGDSGV